MMNIDQTSSCIVIVDDNEEILQLYKGAIEIYYNNSIKVNVFSSLSENFFNFIRDEFIDLFIVDIHLGSMSGIDLCSELLLTMKGLTFLFISGYDYSIDSFKHFDGKCIYDYMSKPTDMSEFLIRVKALLNISKSYNLVIRYIDLIQQECHEISLDNLRRKYLDSILKDQLMIEKIRGQSLQLK